MPVRSFCQYGVACCCAWLVAVVGLISYSFVNFLCFYFYVLYVIKLLMATFSWVVFNTTFDHEGLATQCTFVHVDLKSMRDAPLPVMGGLGVFGGF